jgi:hypothetical protein
MIPVGRRYKQKPQWHNNQNAEQKYLLDQLRFISLDSGKENSNPEHSTNKRADSRDPGHSVHIGGRMLFL